MRVSCLNCQTPLQGSFCHQCGQKSSTHRITFSKFIQHDLIHGLFHLDKGVLYTLRSLLYSPGYAAKSFIEGKRVMHYNIFALFIIVVALKTLVDLQVSPNEVFQSTKVPNQDADKVINGAIRHYYKLLYLLIIPILSLFSNLLLRKLKFNYTEHLVLNAFLLSGGFFYALLFSLFEFFTGAENVSVYGMGFIAIYIMLGYYQASYGHYHFLNYFWRSLLILILFLSLLFMVLCAIIYSFYGGVFEGLISI